MQGKEEEQPRRANKKSRKDMVCGFCGLKGHSTKRSKACLHYNISKAHAPDNGVNVTPATTKAPDAAEDTADYDTLPLQEDPHSDVEDVTLANFLNDDPALCDLDSKDLYSAAI
jgi:hypothetical protein